jgi:hypothetical protein
LLHRCGIRKRHGCKKTLEAFFFVVMDIASSTIGTNRDRPIRFSLDPES